MNSLGSTISWQTLSEETRFILAIALIFFCTALLVVLILFISRVRKNLLHRKTENLTQNFQGILNSIIVNAAMQESIPAPAVQFQIAEIKKITDGSSFATQLLISQLVRLKKNLTGASSDVLRQLYLGLDLQNFSLKRLKSFHWYARARAMRELREMQIAEGAPRIEKNLSSRNNVLREEAFLALVNLKSETPLYFLEGYKFPITEWMQLNIYEFLQKLDPRKLPNFAQWFLHQNKSISLFAIRMASQFKQYSAARDLAIILESGDLDIRCAAMKALSDLEVTAYADKLITMQESVWQPSALAKLFVQFIGKAQQTTETVDALCRFLLHPDYEVRFAAAENLLNDRAGRDYNIQRIREIAGTSGEAMVRHLSEPLLK